MGRRKPVIRASKKPDQIIAFAAPVSITAAQTEGESKGPPRFDVTAYTGGAMEIAHYDLPVVIDLAGLGLGKSLIANLDHEASKRVGHVTETEKADGKLHLSGVVSAATEAAREVVESAANGFVWQASVEVQPTKIVELAAGKTAEVNGQTISGPAYITRKGTLKGFGFVSHGADDNTTVFIAASAANSKGKVMKAEVKAWAEAMLPGIDIDELTPEQVAGIEANYEGRNAKPAKKVEATNPFEIRKLEAKRRDEIRDIADKFIERRGGHASIEEIEAIEKLHHHAIEHNMTAQEFRLEMYEAMNLPAGRTVPSPRGDRGLSNRVLEAAICEAGRLSTLEKSYTDQELQLAHDRFPQGISLGQLFILAAEANGYRGTSGGKVTLDVQRAAFGMLGPRQIQAQGWSTLSIATIISNTANKFLREGWMAVDQTALRISAIRSVSDFKTITTVSLTGDLEYEKLGPAGEIKHGTLGEETYTNKVDTYARMLAITRVDMINDDLGALTAVPRRLGRGAMLKLNDIFWAEFLGLVSANFFASGNSNINTGVATMTSAGLAATEVIFMAQTDPDGKPLAVMPEIILVPPALKAAALALMTSEKIKGDADEPDGNVWRGRFRVESSPYISNSSYTGNTAVGWWMLADPSEVPVIEIAALNGRVEPTVESADADFNSLGTQMRGYADVGVNEQEYRGGVYADGGSS